ncbi:site-specific integrase [Kordia jejudonensis]|uniref:hypothetical protein n=1 Tax=Kordia jejudonensis TaxID=1348245 RepID=UPI0006294ABF|nr:hypothetical protein [Kordia jejudonensis]
MRKKLPNNKHKGLYIYCNNCSKYFSYTNITITDKETGKKIKKEPTCGKSKKKLSSCKFPEKHRFKSMLHYPGQNTSIKSKTLDAQTYEEAVIKAIEFEQEFEAEIMADGVPTKVSDRFYLRNAQIEYIEYINDVDVPAHKVKDLSEDYKKDIFLCLKYFNQALIKNNVKPRLLLLTQINDYHVGYLHDYLLNHVEGIKSGTTYNNKMNRLKGFFDWAIKHYKLYIDNPFKEVKKRTATLKKDAITANEFKKLLEIISPETGSVIIGESKTKKNRYKPYLKDGIELVLHTGGRRDEVVDMTWNMVKEIDNKPTYIEVPNFKVLRLKGDGYNDNVPPKIIPITKSLYKLLLRLGYNENKGSHEHVLVPDRSKTSANAIKENLSKGFSHYYSLLDTGHKLQMKSLRKTYLTYLKIALGDDAKKLSSHANDEILEKHYIDDKVISKAIQDFEIFAT